MKNLIYIILSVSFFACQYTDKNYNDKFQEWDESMDRNRVAIRDSLLSVDTNRLQPDEKAYYFILLAAANDKNYDSISPNINLHHSIEYFKNQEDYYNLARAEYYLGKRYFYENKNVEEACELFKEAEYHFIGSKSTDYKLLGLIYYQLAYIYEMQKFNSEGQDYYQKAILNFQNSKDTTSTILTYRALSTSYSVTEHFEKSKNYIDSSLILLHDLKEDPKQKVKLEASILNSLVYLYRKSQDLEKALTQANYNINLLEKEDIPVPFSYYSQKIGILTDLNQTDSVEYYAQKLLESSNYGTLHHLKLHLLLIRAKEKKGDYKEAFFLCKKYDQLKDSFNQKNKSKQIIELEKKYNYAEKERQYFEEKSNKLILGYILLGFVSLCSILFLCFRWQHEKLKRQHLDEKEERLFLEEENLELQKDNFRLKKRVVKTGWGYELLNQLLENNLNSYDEMEKHFNQNVRGLPEQFFVEFRSIIRAQKRRNAERLFMAITNVDKPFIDNARKACPDINTDEIMLTFMLKHKWDIVDVSNVMQCTIDAVRKRRQRIKSRIQLNLKRKIDWDEFIQTL